MRFKPFCFRFFFFFFSFPLVAAPELFLDRLLWVVGKGQRTVSWHGEENNTHPSPTKVQFLVRTGHPPDHSSRIKVAMSAFESREWCL